MSSMLCLYPSFKTTKQRLYVFLVFLFISFTSFAQVNVNDSLALVQLYNSTNGSTWSNNSGWLSDPVQDWHGVTLTNNRVTALFLQGNNLTGTLPPAIGDLEELQTLFLVGNAIGGNLPPQIGNLSKVTLLYLLGNSFTGPLPNTLGGMTGIVEMHLASNQFNGPIPDVFNSFQSLVNLNLKNNSFSGSIPPSIGDAANLQFIELQNNELTGTIPMSISRPNLLRQIYLNGNNLDGPLPSDLGNATNLEGLYLHNNQITGNLPSSLGQLTKLKILDFSNNQLDGSLPASWGAMSDVLHIYLQNNQLQGDIPPTFANLGNFPSLLELKLENNELDGDLPANFSNLTTLKKLQLNNNLFTGTVPADWGQLTNMETLLLNDNNLVGAVPPQTANMTSLRYLDLSNNALVDLPNLSTLNNLVSLYVGNNKLTFEDLEPNVGVPSSNFGYAPQATVNIAYTINTSIGASESLIALVGGSDNVYQWQKDGADINDEIESLLLLEPINSLSGGTYVCAVTNKTVENLTIYRKPIEVVVDNPLPVELLNFEAKVVRMDVALTWVTQMENENAYFKIERSQDGINFEPITTVLGRGTTEEETYYTHIDEEPYFGVSYYRLRQVDYDGTSTLSEVISVEVEEFYIDRLFPNPVLAGQELTVRSNISGNIRVSIVDLNGLEVLQTEFRNQNTFQELQLSTENVVPGFYFIVLDNNFKRIVRKVSIL